MWPSIDYKRSSEGCPEDPYFEEIREPPHKHPKGVDIIACDLPVADQISFLQSKAYQDALATYGKAHARCVAQE
eukprot:12924401-Prorocentrum_lima.AAC.1